jgi:hypothetical protein
MIVLPEYEAHVVVIDLGVDEERALEIHSSETVEACI